MKKGTKTAVNFISKLTRTPDNVSSIIPLFSLYINMELGINILYEYIKNRDSSN